MWATMVKDVKDAATAASAVAAAGEEDANSVVVRGHVSVAVTVRGVLL